MDTFQFPVRLMVRKAVDLSFLWSPFNHPITGNVFGVCVCLHACVCACVWVGGGGGGYVHKCVSMCLFACKSGECASL